MQGYVQIEKELDCILAKHIVCNTELQTLVRDERQFIIHNTLDKLEQVNEKKLQCKEIIADLERQREPLMKKFREKYNFTKQNIHLNDLIEVVSEPYRTLYKEHRETLKTLIHAIKITHEGNKILIHQALSFHERSFHLLFGLTKDKLGYAKTGEMTHKNKRLIDSVV